MSARVEQILEQVRALTLPEREQLLGFLERERVRAGSRPSGSAVSRVRGRYAHVPTSSEAFCSRKAEEIATEDRRGLK